MKFRSALLFLAVLSTLVSCEKWNSHNNDSVVTTKVIVPEDTTFSNYSENGDGGSAPDKLPESFPLVGPGYRLMSYQLVDLDNNEDEEEILLVKPVKGESQNLEIVIIDVIGNTDGEESYRKISQEKLSTDSLTSLKLEIIDVTGDTRNEIICTGFTSSGNQTLDIFLVSYLTLSLEPVFNQSVKGSIELYAANQNEWEDVSEAMVVVHKDNEATPSDTMDLIKEVYQWYPQTRSFVLSSSETLSVEKISQDKLTDLFYGSEKDFEKYLSGAWLKINDMEQKDRPLEIVFFDPKGKYIYYYNNEILESYEWNQSRKLVHNKLYVESKNDLIESLNCVFYITIIDYDLVQITVTGIFSDLNGQYKKINIPLDRLTQSINEKDSAAVKEVPNGIYKGNNSFDLYFQLPKVTLIKKDRSFTGIAELFAFNGKTFLEFSFPESEIPETGINKVYIVDYYIRDDKNHIIKTLILEPVELTAENFIPLSMPTLRMEQIEISPSQKEP